MTVVGGLEVEIAKLDRERRGGKRRREELWWKRRKKRIQGGKSVSDEESGEAELVLNRPYPKWSKKPKRVRRSSSKARESEEESKE